ncbi:MAG: twin transmembrane helix small protein [Steroidobacteraceae bacterium]|jgi:hypothetical protein
MQSLLHLVILLMLLAIVVSLGTALYHLARGQGDSRKMVRALSIRVGLSLALFFLLMIAWYFGLIVPHGLEPR